MHTLGTRLSYPEAITVSDEDWRQHCYAIGQTGTDKTTWLLGRMKDDLAAGRGFCFVDKHGDAAKQIADHARKPIVYWRPADLSYPIGFNPLQSVEIDRRWRMTADVVSVFADIWNLGESTPRLLYFLRASVRLLLDSAHTTLLDIRRVLSNETYRSRLLRRCVDSQTPRTWDEFSHKSAKDQAIEIGSLQNKAGALVDPLPLRLTIGQPTSTIDIRRIMDAGTVLVIDLSGLDDEPARPRCDPPPPETSL